MRTPFKHHTGKTIAIYGQYQGPVIGVGWTKDSKRIVFITNSQAKLRWQSIGSGDNTPTEQQASVSGQIYDTINKHVVPIQAIAWSSKDVGASVDEKQVLQVWHTKVSSL